MSALLQIHEHGPWIAFNSSKTAPFICWNYSITVSLDYGIGEGVFPDSVTVNFFFFMVFWGGGVVFFLVCFEFFEGEWGTKAWKQDPTSFCFLLALWKFHRRGRILEFRRNSHYVTNSTAVWLCAWPGLLDPWWELNISRIWNFFSFLSFLSLFLVGARGLEKTLLWCFKICWQDFD